MNTPLETELIAALKKLEWVSTDGCTLEQGYGKYCPVCGECGLGSVPGENNHAKSGCWLDALLQTAEAWK